MSPIKVSRPVEGAPKTFENDLQRAVYQSLDALGISYTRVENDPAVTMDDCKAIDEAFGERTVKTIFLTNRQGTKFYLLAMPADKPFVTRLFGAALMIPRVSFADSDTLMAVLGTPQGAASPLSTIADKECRVEMAIDTDLLASDKIVCTDCTLHGFVCLPIIELIDKYLDSNGHKPHLIKM